MIVKITILRLLGSSDDKEKIGVARPDDGFWRCVGLTGVKCFSGSFSPTTIFAWAAYIYPQGRVI